MFSPSVCNARKGRSGGEIADFGSGDLNVSRILTLLRVAKKPIGRGEHFARKDATRAGSSLEKRLRPTLSVSVSASIWPIWLSSSFPCYQVVRSLFPPLSLTPASSPRPSLSYIHILWRYSPTFTKTTSCCARADTFHNRDSPLHHRCQLQC